MKRHVRAKRDSGPSWPRGLQEFREIDLDFFVSEIKKYARRHEIVTLFPEFIRESLLRDIERKLGDCSATDIEAFRTFMIEQWHSDVALAKALIASVAFDLCFSRPDPRINMLTDEAVDRTLAMWNDKYHVVSGRLVLADIASEELVESMSVYTHMRIINCIDLGRQATKNWSETLADFQQALNLWRVGPNVDLPKTPSIRSKIYSLCDALGDLSRSSYVAYATFVLMADEGKEWRSTVGRINASIDKEKRGQEKRGQYPLW